MNNDSLTKFLTSLFVLATISAVIGHIVREVTKPEPNPVEIVIEPVPDPNFSELIEPEPEPQAVAAHPRIEREGYTNKFHVLYFSSPSCAPCKEAYEYVLRAREQGYRIYGFDKRYHQDVFDRFGVGVLPTTIIMNDGAIQERLVGKKSEQFYLDTYRKYKEAD